MYDAICEILAGSAIVYFIWWVITLLLMCTLYNLKLQSKRKDYDSSKSKHRYSEMSTVSYWQRHTIFSNFVGSIF